MTLIASISGVRGTLGGEPGKNLTPLDIVEFTSAFGMWLSSRSELRKVVIGRDARPSGPMVESLVCGTLTALGFEVINLGLSTTPTVEMAVPHHNASGGIVITASHNPAQWNALKLLNSRGEFVTAKDGKEILSILQGRLFNYVGPQQIGTVTEVKDFAAEHIRQILALPMVEQYAIGKANFKIVVDAVNSSGGVFVPQLLEALGITQVTLLNCTPDGNFAHNPEPLQENLTEICGHIRTHGADLGIVVDPDVDRLVLVDEKGNLFGEEYTLVAVADYILQQKKGSVVSNLSSSRALRDLAAQHGVNYHASAVGEVNVTEKMKRHNAVIGGEGNGGVILPELHYGRDALVGIALFLSHLAKAKCSVSELRSRYPSYFMSKQKAELGDNTDVDALLRKIEASVTDGEVNTVDGVKIDFADSWVHLRKSNTEPIVRIYTEAPTQSAADALADTWRDRLVGMR
jgi:phosphomannomutase